MVILLRRQPPGPPLFPYTTLFRSAPVSPLAQLDFAAALTPAGAIAVRPGLRWTLDADGELRTAVRNLSLPPVCVPAVRRSEEHTSELQSRRDLVCRLPLEKKKKYL